MALKSTSVKIGVDTADFLKSMKSVQTEINATTKTATELQKGLELEFDESRMEAALTSAQKALALTESKAEELKKQMQVLEDAGRVDTADYEKLTTELAKTETNAIKLEAKIEDIQNMKMEALTAQFESVGNAVSSVGDALAPLSTLAAAAATAVTALTVSSSAAAAEVDDMAKAANFSVEELQELLYVTEQLGVENSTLERALIKTEAAYADLNTEAGTTQSAALESLNIQIGEFEDSEEVFYGIVEALREVEDATLQTSLANDIFGDSIADSMLLYINAADEEIEQFTEEINNIGVQTQEQIDILAGFDDSINELKASISNVSMEIAEAFIPVLQIGVDLLMSEVIPTIQTFAYWFRDLDEFSQKAVVGLTLFVAALSPVTKGISSIITLIPKLYSVLTTLAAHPIILIIAAVTLLLVVLYTQSEVFREAVASLAETLSNALQPVLEILATTFDMVVNALSPLFDLFELLMQIVAPMITIALLPLELALTALSVPLKLLSTLLSALSPIFVEFASVVEGVFETISSFVDKVLEKIEDGINYAIGLVNKLIAMVNNVFALLGIEEIGMIGEVSLTGDTEDTTSSSSATTSDSLSDIDWSDYTSDDDTDSGTVTYDSSTDNSTTNIEVVINNYAAELDIDNMIEQINIALAENY